MITKSLQILIPTPYGTNSGRQKLVQFYDAEVKAWRDSVTGIENLKTPDQCPTALLPDLGDYLEAGIRVSDTERKKRQRIQYAVRNHKKAGIFSEIVKPAIDALTGLDADIVLVSELTNQNFYLQINQNAVNRQAVMGDGSPSQNGILMEDGEGNASQWVIRIDLGGDAGNPSAGVIADVVAYFEQDFNPAYLVIHLGWIDSGIFYTYPNGVIQ